MPTKRKSTKQKTTRVPQENANLADAASSKVSSQSLSEDSSKAEEIIAKVVKKEAPAETKIVPTEQLISFKLDEEEYASIITDLREIIRVPEITPIPGAPDFIRGILNLRGQIVVVIDLEKRFHLQREHPIDAKHIIIAEVEDSIFGVTVDEVTGVLRVPQSSITPTPQLITSKIHADYLQGVVILREEDNEDVNKGKKSVGDKENAQEKSRLLLLLDIPKMLAEKELLEIGNVIQKTLKQSTNG